ncbi:MAG: nitroreductase family deazaflavin-dependent oxidoreductase [Acidimicrobiales bacterium]
MSDTPDTDAMKNWNQQIIDEFRANAGVVGGPFEGQMMALLTTTGAKTGNAHTTPLVAGPAGDDVYVIASAAGSPKHPAWYTNLLANPTVTVEVTGDTFTATARPADEPQRSELYAAMVERMPQFADYQKDNPRTIPVVVLERA